MSVLIKGMEMPEEGEYHMTLYVCSDGSAYIDVASFPVDGDRFEAVPVPSHGRLISADELIEFIENRYEITWKDDYEGGIKDACVDILEKISTMPTVIPASEEE